MSRVEKTKRFVAIMKKQGIYSELEAILETKDDDTFRTKEEIEMEIEKLLKKRTLEEALTHLINKMSTERFKYYETCFEI